MSFQRTRMSADRTLMSVIRTSLSLISFGFTIFQFFEKLQEAKVLTARRMRRATSASRWSRSASCMLVLGIVYHVQFMLGLREQRERDDGGRADPRRERVPAVADADHRGDPAR